MVVPNENGAVPAVEVAGAVPNENEEVEAAGLLHINRHVLC